jgi:SagB-type dehydrogenase family enzyme
MPELRTTKAMEYLEQSCHDRATIRHRRRPEIAGTARFKTYPEAERIVLPVDWSPDEPRLLPLLQKRRSQRRYAGAEPLALRDLSFMLWAAQGITARMGNHYLRTAPSAGALYPIETYLVVERVAGLTAGLYHFEVEHFQLERLSAEVRGKDAAHVCLDQDFIGQADLTFFWTAIFRRSMAKYGERGLRYLFLDAGHICQNLLLAAESLSCGGCPVAAFYDQEADALLGLDGRNEAVIYAASVGRK